MDDPPIFFDLDDAEHTKAARLARVCPGPEGRVRAYAAVPILWWSERRAIALARSTFVASARDGEGFRYFPRHSERVVVPNAVRLPAPQSLAADPTIRYVGNYMYASNVEAVEYLLQEIWPRARALGTAGRLFLAGPEPERISSHGLFAPGIEFTGFVEKLSALYWRMWVVCCPIRVAGSTRLKILEAAAYRKPMVSKAAADRLGAE